MLLGGSILYVSGRRRILSGHVIGELLPGPAQAKADGIGGAAQGLCDLARLELLPSPEPEDLLVGDGKGRQSRGEISILHRVRRILASDRLPLRLETLHESEPTGSRPTVVGQGATGHAIGPGKDGFSGHVVEPAPDREQDIGEHVV